MSSLKSRKTRGKLKVLTTDKQPSPAQATQGRLPAHMKDEVKVIKVGTMDLAELQRRLDDFNRAL